MALPYRKNIPDFLMGLRSGAVTTGLPLFEFGRFEKNEPLRPAVRERKEREKTELAKRSDSPTGTTTAWGGGGAARRLPTLVREADRLQHLRDVAVSG